MFHAPGVAETPSATPNVASRIYLKPSQNVGSGIVIDISSPPEPLALTICSSKSAIGFDSELSSWKESLERPRRSASSRLPVFSIEVLMTGAVIRTSGTKSSADRKEGIFG
eukprot:9004070-Pyramimonas_sp.AAC.1